MAAASSIALRSRRGRAGAAVAVTRGTSVRFGAVRRYMYAATPVGEVLLVADGPAARLTGLYWPGHRRTPRVGAAWVHDDGAFDVTLGQLEEYFAGERTRFDL